MAGEKTWLTPVIESFESGNSFHAELSPKELETLMRSIVLSLGNVTNIESLSVQIQSAKAVVTTKFTVDTPIGAKDINLTINLENITDPQGKSTGKISVTSFTVVPKKIAIKNVEKMIEDKIGGEKINATFQAQLNRLLARSGYAVTTLCMSFTSDKLVLDVSGEKTKSA